MSEPILTPGELKEVLLSPKSVSTDGTSATAHGVSDIIDAINFLNEEKAKGRRKLPVSIGKIRPGGAV